MSLSELITGGVLKGIEELFGALPNSKQIQLQKTRKEFEGDITVVVFPLLSISKKSPEETGKLIGDYLCSKLDQVTKYNVVKGFLNLVIDDSFYIDFLLKNALDNDFGKVLPDNGSKKIMVEYSSPNTNKPLHLGHIRNNLLGNSVCRILAANGYKVIKTNIVNDRGIHICKSMIAWEKWGRGATPDSTGLKGDHLVGDYYVKFDQEYKVQVNQLISEKGLSKADAEKQAPLLLEAQEMLRKWENKDPQVLDLWERMNGWVYDGFDVTYKRLGVDFDKIYYESDTYLVGKETVLEGLERKVFKQHVDKSVWADLTNDGLDEKILLRSDGTSVYMTQDIGTAQLRQNDYNPDKMVYVVGNEQNYHFKVLALILDKLGFSWAKGIHHMSYGMVELPEGKMKSREGTVVDADDLLDEMTDTARKMSDELGKLEGFTEEEKKENYRIIGLGALKYFILKVDPVKNMTFDPKESIDFNGNTGPFIQYTYARIRSIFRKAEESSVDYLKPGEFSSVLFEKEKNLIKLAYEFPDIIRDSGESYSPALLANYIYDLVKEFNQFYHDHSVLHEPDLAKRNLRLSLSYLTSNIIRTGMELLGIEMPERM